MINKSEIIQKHKDQSLHDSSDQDDQIHKKKQLDIQQSDDNETNKSQLLQQQIHQLKSVNHIDKDFLCSICLNYIVLAVSTKCGHNFCELCLSEYLLCLKNCPACSTNLRKSKSCSCTLLDEIIIEYIKHNHTEELEPYNMRVQETKDWRNNKQLKVVNEVGIKIDALDKNYVWKVATVKKIKFSSETRTRSYIIHFDGWPGKNDEDIPEVSSKFRFAPLGFYTQRKDIPHYDITSQNQYLRKFLQVKSYEDELMEIDRALYIQEDSSEVHSSGNVEEQ